LTFRLTRHTPALGSSGGRHRIPEGSRGQLLRGRTEGSRGHPVKNSRKKPDVRADGPGIQRRHGASRKISESSLSLTGQGRRRILAILGVLLKVGAPPGENGLEAKKKMFSWSRSPKARPAPTFLKPTSGMYSPE
jgi:hypothetical protein